MRLYLDDDLDSNALIGLLLQAGHQVVSPRAVGTRGVLENSPNLSIAVILVQFYHE